MAATTKAVHKNCCVFQWFPRDRMWMAHTRVGPTTTLRRLKDFEGNPVDFEPAFRRFLRCNEVVFCNDEVEWTEIDTYSTTQYSQER
jgi:hypothetical protein